MALFDSILTDIYTLTNRPNLMAESKLGIRVATTKLHGLEFWREDRIEEELAVTPVDSTFSVDLATSLLYKPRHLDYIKKVGSDVYFEEITPRQLLDSYGYRRFNTFYRAGNNLHFLTDTSDTSILLSYYRQPVPTEASYSSWIAETYPIFIAIEAAIFVFSSIGDKEQEKRMQDMANINLATLQINHLDPT